MRLATALVIAAIICSLIIASFALIQPLLTERDVLTDSLITLSQRGRS